MNIYTEATITTEDAAAEVALQGLKENGAYRVTFSGDDLTIATKDPRGRWSRVDHLIGVSKSDPKRGGKGITFEGVSTALRDGVGLSEQESHITLMVVGEECLSCL